MWWGNTNQKTVTDAILSPTESICQCTIACMCNPVLWTHKVLCGILYAPYINFHSFIYGCDPLPPPPPIPPNQGSAGKNYSNLKGQSRAKLISNSSAQCRFPSISEGKLQTTQMIWQLLHSKALLDIQGNLAKDFKRPEITVGIKTTNLHIILSHSVIFFVKSIITFCIFWP